MDKVKERINALFEDETFSEKLAVLDNAEDFRKLLNEYGIEISEAELAELITLAVPAQKTDELSETELDEVAGGTPCGAVSTAWKAWKFACSYWGSPQAAIKATFGYR